MKSQAFIAFIIIIVCVADFGLAKEHNEFSVMKSVVGTMLYWRYVT